MSLIGVLWLILIVLKIVGVINAGWLILIFWPLIPAAIIFILTVLGVVSVAALRGR